MNNDQCRAEQSGIVVLLVFIVAVFILGFGVSVGTLIGKLLA